MNITTYAHLEQYLCAFASGTVKRLFITGNPGTGKSRTVKMTVGECGCHISGKVTGFELYKELYWHRNLPIVLDDNDGLLSDRESVRLLKELCDTNEPNQVHWRSRLLGDGDGGDNDCGENCTEKSIPKEFCTSSPVIIITNDWERLNTNVGALEDRGFVIHFKPSAEEIHRRVRDWFGDTEIYDWIARHLQHIPQHSMRFYIRSLELKSSGIDWRDWLLHEWHKNSAIAIILRLLEENLTQGERAKRYSEQTGRSVRDFYNQSRKFKQRKKQKPLQFCSKTKPEILPSTAKLQASAQCQMMEPVKELVGVIDPLDRQNQLGIHIQDHISDDDDNDHNGNDGKPVQKHTSGESATTKMPSLAVLLNRGDKIPSPRGANAIKVKTPNGKKSIRLKKDWDLLKDVGIDDTWVITFGIVPFDGKHRPQFDKFKEVKR